MSYDLMVFSKNKKFENRDQFMDWYDVVTEWEEEVDYDDYKHTTTELQAFFMDIKNTFPPLNGEFAPDDDELDTLEEDGIYAVDYCIANEAIYMAFAWSNADEAYQKVKELATKHKVAFFDVSSNEGEILYPDGTKIS
ncbi:hypothetical protein CAPN008_08240 [Capnocytophaga canis]|uniref:hypothetical protein n=1 Tax=Capnocytophaga canis TaxID=1848903 RepID=UPI001AC18162|nr:hypothetical protein [Capnocytophaga canis]GIM60774.1 hypothetical protein CAPN008_08240 [Capnocytophaga canis]